MKMLNNYQTFLFQVLFILNAHLVVSSSKPNIIFILTDDLGYGDNSIKGYSTSIRDFPNNIETPNLERMVSDGMKFTNAYVDSSVCGPSRYSFMTGRNTGVSQIRGNTGEGEDYALAETDITIFQVMQKQGYDCALIGKWGFKTHPLDVGFSKFYGQLTHKDAHDMFPTKMHNNTATNKQRKANFKLPKNKNAGERRCTESPHLCDFTHDLFTQEALAYIDEKSTQYLKNNSNPFFLFLSYSAPHHGMWGKGPTNRFIAPVYTCPVGIKLPEHASREDYCRYRSLVTDYIDKDVGKILDLIENRKISKTTLVIFTSDNGPDNNPRPYNGLRVYDTHTFKSTSGFRGGKRTVYEGGLRVPFICQWKGKIKGGKTNSLRFQLSDIFSTLAEVAGVDFDSAKNSINAYSTSKSIYNAMKSKNAEDPEYLYFEYCHRQVSNWKRIRENPNSSCSWAIISGDYKLVFDMEDPAHKRKLFNLNDDVFERTNLLLVGTEKDKKEMSRLQALKSKAHVSLQKVGFVGKSKLRPTPRPAKDDPNVDIPPGKPNDDKDSNDDHDDKNNPGIACSCTEGVDLINRKRGICVSPEPDCVLVDTLEEAQEVCEKVNARLCTADEARKYVPTGAECSMDGSYVWTDQKCSNGKTLYVRRKRRRKRCRTSYRAKVRCCRDLCS